MLKTRNIFGGNKLEVAHLALSLKDVSFSYGRQLILNQIGFTAKQGECVAIAGSNGIGKSTILSLIAGIFKPTSGSIEASKKIAYVPQHISLFEDMTVWSNLKFFADMEKAEITPPLPFDVLSYKRKRVSKLSYGMKKRVSLACALLGDPELVLLDEPCNGLDAVYRAELVDLILQLKSEGKTILYVGHDPTEYLSFFDRLIILKHAALHIFERDQLFGDVSDTEMQKSILTSAYHTLYTE